MKYPILSALYYLTLTAVYSQTGNWDVYLAQYDEGLGSVTLDMGLVNDAPISKYPYVLVTGSKYADCGEDGFPKPGGFDRLYEIQDSINKVLESFTFAKQVGSFTYQCERLEYIYLNDTTNVRARLRELYSSEYPDLDFYINIQHDPQWEYYLQFLYPNEDIMDYMQNQKVLNQLEQAGDDLSKPRQVDHWIYFGTEEDRRKFSEYATGAGFKVEGESKDSEPVFPNLPYMLHISRVDRVDYNSINVLTAELRSKATLYDGEYNGWETFIVKD